MDDINKMVEAVQAYMRRCMEPFQARLKALEERPTPREAKDFDPAMLREEVQKAVDAIPRPQDGKSVDPAEVIRAAREAVEALPKPEDGRSVSAEEVAALVRQAVEALPAPKDGKSVDLVEVETMVRGAVDAIEKPKDGASVTLEDVRPLVEEIVDRAVEALPKPADGKDVDPESVREMVAAAVEALPKPKDGEPGKSFTFEEVRALVDIAVKDAVAQIPKPKDGEDGTSITLEQHENIVAKWELAFERRANDFLQRAVDKFPVPKDGKDALNLEDLTVEHDGDGNVTFKFQRGALTKEFSIRLPRFKDKGGYRPEVQYLEGDGVSFGGSLFLAQKDAPAGKPGESEDWRMAVKRGRDGKDAVVKDAVQRGPVSLA